MDEKKEKQTLFARESAVLAILAIFSVVALIASINIYLESPGGNSPGLFPTLASAGMVLTCFIAIVQVWQGNRKKKETESEDQNKKPQSTWDAIKICIITEVPFTVFVMMVATILYAVAMNFLRFYISTVLYMTFSIVFLYRGTHWKRAIVVSVGFAIAVYVIIELIFQVRMP